MRALLLRVLNLLHAAGSVAFIAGWVVGFSVHPSPRWLFPAMGVAFGVALGSALLCHACKRVFAHLVESDRWELETPTTLGNLVRQNWVGPLGVWICFSVVAVATLRDQLQLRAAVAIPLGLIAGSAVSSTFVFAHARGWVRDE